MKRDKTDKVPDKVSTILIFQWKVSGSYEYYDY